MVNILKRFKLSFVLAKKAFGRYKFYIVVLTILGFVSGVLGGLGINALIPLLSFIVGEGGGGEDFISKNIQSFFTFLNIDFSLETILIFIILLFILKAITLVIFSYIDAYITSSYEADTRSRIFSKMTKANWQYLLGEKLGHLEKVLMNNVEQSRNFLALISLAVMALSNLIVYIFIAVNISLAITIFTLFLGGVLFLFMIPLLKRIKNVSYAQERINREVAHHINENILGMKLVKTMLAGHGITKTGKGYFQDIKRIKIKASVLGALTSVLIEPVTIIFVAIIFAVSYKAIGFEFATILVLVYVIKQIFIYVRQIQDLAVGVTTYTPYLENILEYENKIENEKEIDSGKLNFVFNDKLEFKKVSFFYRSEKPILKDVSFEIKRGEMVGLVGPSGAGKTTIVDLILRLFEPKEGQVLIDGVDARRISLDDWRKNIGYVSQDLFLINDTIANNIKFYDQSISQDTFTQAAKEAGIFDFVNGLPNKFETLVGERGIELSVGQRQRVAIARVLARKPKILILDEATSSLDNESEKKIQDFINSMKGKITVFVIAHRLSTVINSDRLIILENGKISEEGGPEDLLKDKTSYFYKVFNINK